MEIVVIGGTGLIGSKTVAILRPRRPRGRRRLTHGSIRLPSSSGGAILRDCDPGSFVEIYQGMTKGPAFFQTFVPAMETFPAKPMARICVLESFFVESWLEHQRQHRRVTHVDQLDLETLNAFHIGSAPPIVRHLLRAV